MFLYYNALFVPFHQRVAYLDHKLNNNVIEDTKHIPMNLECYI